MSVIANDAPTAVAFGVNDLSVSSNTSDKWVALVSISVALAIIVTVVQTFDVSSYHSPSSSSFFPLVLAYLLLLCGLFLGDRARRVGRARTSPPDATAPAHYGRAAFGVMALLLYGVGIFTLGFWPASVIVALVLGLLLRDAPWSRRFLWQLVAIGLTVPAIVALVFDVFAGVQMPPVWGVG